MTFNLGVSVIIPTYNRASLVRRAVHSALQEIDADDEIMVVDDGSTDDTEKVLEPYLESIRYMKLAHSGAGATRNRGIQEATKPLVAFLDSDDEWMPGKLALHKRFMEARPEVLFSFTDFAVQSKSGEVRRRYLRNWHRDPRSWNEILGPGVPYSRHAPLPRDLNDFLVHSGDLYLPMAARCYVATFTLVVRREEAGDALFFAEDLPLFEDWYCFARLAGAGVAAYLDVETAWNHGDADDRLTSGGSLIKAQAYHAILQRVYESDQTFLEQHRDFHKKLLDDLRRFKVPALIADGRTREAREELAGLQDPPLHQRILAMFPGWLARLIVMIRRSLKGDRVS